MAIKNCNTKVKQHKQDGDEQTSSIPPQSGTRNEINDAVNSGVRINLIIVQYINIFTQIVVCWQGKWHKDFFTNGDVLDLLKAIKICSHIGDICEHFYTIVTSACPTTMTKYKLYKKAEKIMLQAKGRKSSRRRSSHATKPPGYCCKT